MDLFRLLRTAGQRADFAFNTALGNADLTPTQYVVLSAIGATKGCSQSDVVEKSGVDRSTCAALLTRLDHRKLAKRTRSQEDARRWELSLTAAGSKLVERGDKAKQWAEGALSYGKDRREIERVLKSLGDAKIPDIKEAA